jgi:hypothetical protein
MNIHKHFLIIALSIAAVTLQAQTLTEFKPKDSKYGLNKARDAKRIYIANFSVNYQVYNEKEDFKQGGAMLGGGRKGDAKAQLSVGLTGLSENDVQQITDKLYQDFLAQIKAKGLQLITADEASKLESYSDYTRLQGGKASLAQYPGMMATAPTGYEWFVKKLDKDGKAKSGGFLNNPAMMYPKLSKDLDNAIIANVNMFVMFVQDQEAFQGAGANIKVKTNLRLAGQEAIVMTSDAKIKMKGQNEIIPITSSVAFYHGKMGMGSTTSYTGTLSKGLGILGVIEDTKLQSFAKNDADVMGTRMGMYKVFMPDNVDSKSTKIIEVDSKKYIDGVYNATSTFLNHHTKDFLSAL